MLVETLDDRVRKLNLNSRIRELSLEAGEAIDGFVRDVSFTALCARDSIASIARLARNKVSSAIKTVN
jgi:hypothetical protein